MVGIGVLLFHSTQYGKADFNIQGAVEGLFNAFSTRFDKQEAKEAFINEAEWCENDYEEFQKVIQVEETEERDAYEDTVFNVEYAEELFEETWNEFWK